MNAIIIDDELHAVKNLQSLLTTYTTDVTVTGTATSVQRALPLLQKHPDIIFLDIRLHEHSGFELLPFIKTGTSAVIFVSAYDNYSLQALKAGATDYLLKPVDIDELRVAIQKAELLHKIKKDPGNQLHHVSSETSDVALKKMRSLTITGQQGFEMVPLSDIIFIEADGNYSIVYLTNLKKIVATKQVGEFDELLAGNGFFRIHKSAIINLSHLKSYDSREGHTAKMTDGLSIPISGRRLGDFMKAVDQYAKNI